MKNKHAQQLGKLGGLVKSEAKAKAAQENGKKGGRPKNTCKCDRMPFETILVRDIKNPYCPDCLLPFS